MMTWWWRRRFAKDVFVADSGNVGRWTWACRTWMVAVGLESILSEASSASSQKRRTSKTPRTNVEKTKAKNIEKSCSYWQNENVPPAFKQYKTQGNVSNLVQSHSGSPPWKELESGIAPLVPYTGLRSRVLGSNPPTPLSGQTPCPCPTCPTKIWRPPFSLSQLSHVLHLVPTCPIWLYHLSFPNSLSWDFVWVSHWRSIFRKTLSNEKFAPKYYHVGEGMNNKHVSTKRQETTVTKHSNTFVYLV